MSENTIAVLVYFLVLSALILLIGFVAAKYGYDDDEKHGIILGSIFWPIMIFAFPIFYALRFMYKAGTRIAGKM